MPINREQYIISHIGIEKLFNSCKFPFDNTIPNNKIAIRLLTRDYATDTYSFGKTFRGIVNNKASISYTQQEEETFTYVLFYITSNVDTPNTEAYYQLEQGSTPTDYVEHKEQNLPLDLRSKNLFDKDNVVQGYLKTDGTIQSTNQFRVSDYIDVSNYSNMVVSGNSGGSEVNCFYDNEKNLIRAVSTGSSTVYAMEVPSNAKYIRVTVRASVLDNYQLEEGTEATDYVPYYNYELSKIEEAEDYFIKENGKWYLHKEVGKKVLNGTENWFNDGNTYKRQRVENIIEAIPISTQTIVKAFSNYYIAKSANSTWSGNIGISISSTGKGIIIYDNNYNYENSFNDYKVWLQTHNLELYYQLETPTNTEITETPLINQLEAIRKAQSYDDQTNINQTNEDLPFILDIETLKK